MNTEQVIKPEKITKPIQLLGAWLAGLFSVNSSFLFAAANMDNGSFESISLVIAAILNVPLFLAAVFLLQTKFRPELQEDSYYSSYLSQKTNQPVTITKSEAQYLELSHKLASIESHLINENSEYVSSENLISGILIGINKHLSNKDYIRAKLAGYGMKGCTSFGSDEHPGNLSVGISEYLSKDIANRILEIAKELGFTHYAFFDNKMEQTEEDVLFGGYGANRYEIA
ncbi:hypothetical protein C1M56_14955 [Vibrio diazotrophicus]|nr:hypothetical protein C1M56_14955 [Vibrio diazotrophicus]